MALTLADRIKQYTTSTGSGDVSFTGTPAGFASFSSVLSVGDLTYYCIEENDKWEVGIGTYGSDNMVRSQVLASSNGGSHVDLGGSGVVFITYPSDKATYLNENDEYVLGASGLLFSNGTVFKEAKLTELTDVAISGTVVSTHVFALNNTNKSILIGDVTGPSNSNNTLIGYGAASGITSGTDNVAVGTESAIANNAGIENVSIGTLSGPSETVYTNPASYVVSVGYKAGSRAKSKVTAIGHQAGIAAYETGFVAVGSAAGSGIGSYSVGVGNEAAHGMGSDYVVAVGYQAAKSAAGESAVWVGNMAGAYASPSTKSVGIGYQAGKSSSATDSIYIGQNAGQSNSDDDYLYIANGSPSSSRTLIKGDMQSKRLAVGAADVTLEDTFYIGIASSADKGLVVKSAAGQSDDLTQWQTSVGGSLASVSSLGVITANQIVASGQGLKFSISQVPTTTTNTLYGFGGTLYWGLDPVTAPTGVEKSVAFYNNMKTAIYSDDFTFDKDSKTLTVHGSGEFASGVVLPSAVPASTTNMLYNDAGALKFNGAVVGEVTTDQLIYVSGIAVYASGHVHDDLYVSGVATYASGQAIANETDIATNVANISTNVTDIAYVSGIAVYASGHVHDDIYVSGIATYASGQAIANETDIATNTSNISTNTTNISTNSDRVTYASGQAIANETDIVATSGIANYASGQAIANETDIATNVSNISTNTTNITANATAINARSYQNVIGADVSMTDSDDVVFVNSDGSVLNVYIPTAVDNGGKEILVKRVGGDYDVIIYASGSQTIDGQSTFTIQHNYQSTTLISNNTNWFIY